MARVVLTDEAKEDLRDLDRSSQSRVLRKLKELEKEPEKRGQPLGNKSGANLTGLRKLVVGDRQFRIVFRVERDGTVVVVCATIVYANREIAPGCPGSGIAPTR